MQAQSYYSKIRVYQNSQGILMGYQFLESLNYVALNEVQSENYWLKEWRKWEAHGIISDNIPLWCWYLYPHVKPVDVAGSTCIKEWNSRCWIQLRLSWRNFPQLMMFLLGFFFCCCCQLLACWDGLIRILERKWTSWRVHLHLFYLYR